MQMQDLSAYAFYHLCLVQRPLTFALMSNSRLTAALVFNVHYMITMTDLQVRAAKRTREEYIRQTKEMMRDMLYLRKAGKSTFIG